MGKEAALRRFRLNGETRFSLIRFSLMTRGTNESRADSICNLGSVGKLFATTTLAEAVKGGHSASTISVAKYVTELQRGGIFAEYSGRSCESTHSGLPNRPGIRRWHRARSTGQTSSVSYSWRRPIMSLGGSICTPTPPVLLRDCPSTPLQHPFAQLMHQRLIGPLAMSSTALPLPAEIGLVAVRVQSAGPDSAARMEGGAFQVARLRSNLLRHRSTWHVPRPYGRTCRPWRKETCYGRRSANPSSRYVHVQVFIGLAATVISAPADPDKKVDLTTFDLLGSTQGSWA